jgi:hypothetical protein
MPWSGCAATDSLDEQIGMGVIEFKKYMTPFTLGYEDPGRGSSAAINPDAGAFSS